MEDKKKEVDLFLELECAEAYLSDDIQALAYIQDDLETMKSKEMILTISEIKNKVQILLKSMLYNKENIQKALNEANR